LATNGSGVLSWQASVNDPPIGSIVMWVNQSAPTGWLHCNGQAVSRSTYQDLHNLLGDDYGDGDGSNTFNVPDMRGLFVRGWDSETAEGNTTGNDPDKHSRTNRGDGTTGNDVGTKQDDINKSHTHDTKLDANRVYGHTMTGDTTDGVTEPYGSPGTLPGWNIPTNLNATSGGNESRPKNIAMMYIIRAT